MTGRGDQLTEPRDSLARLLGEPELGQCEEVCPLSDGESAQTRIQDGQALSRAARRGACSPRAESPSCPLSFLPFSREI